MDQDIEPTISPLEGNNRTAAHAQGSRCLVSEVSGWPQERQLFVRREDVGRPQGACRGVCFLIFLKMGPDSILDELHNMFLFHFFDPSVRFDIILVHPAFW